MTAMPAASISGAGHVLLAFGGLVTIVEILLGDAVGSLVVVAAVAVLVATYLGLIRPRQVRWEATGDEIRRPMRGDDILGPDGPRAQAIRGRARSRARS